LEHKANARDRAVASAGKVGKNRLKDGGNATVPWSGVGSSNRSRALFLASAALVVTTSSARAADVRAHGTLGAAKAVGGFQERELSFGGVGFLAAEMPFLSTIGAELELGTVLLAQGDPPPDPALRRQGAAHAVFGAIGLRGHPFAKTDPADVEAFSGVWAAGNVALTTTGGRFRTGFDVQAGYDFLLAQGHYGLGPAIGLLHVFQPDNAVRPDDANIVFVAVHAMLDSAPPAKPSDRDGDGLLDRDDGCPDAAEDKDGFEDTDGCPDPDNDEDGVLDGADHCPLDPEDRDGFEDADGCPDPDNDKDGLLDARDKCPNDAEDADGFEDGDGCPDLDNDGDGIPDREDLCPNEPETKNGYADEDGCPDEEQVRVVGQRIVLDDRIHFEVNNAIIRQVSFGLLERVSKLLREHPEYERVEIQGNTDQRGTKAFNQKLSEDRALSVLEFLTKHGVERQRLTSVGFGSEHLFVDKATEHALFLNRRVEFVIMRQVPAGTTTHPVDPPAPASDPARAPARPGKAASASSSPRDVEAP
jgi:outer membrane protein OmpA-like peptidoglycan-associated protein